VTKTDLASRDRDEPLVEALSEAAGIRSSPLDDQHRETLAEVAALGDDDLLERYLEYLELPQDVVAGALPRAVAERRLLPVVFVCPPRHLGAAALLDAIATFAPSPRDRPLRGRDASGHPVELDRDGPLLARVVSAHRDDHGKPFHLLRVESGEATHGEVSVGTTGTKVRIRKLYRLRGPRRAGVDHVVPGMLVATWDPLPVRPGDTLTADPTRTLEPLAVAPPMMTWALRAARRRGSERLVEALEAVTSADPGLSFAFDPTGTALLSGADDEHLRIAVERMEEWAGVKVTGELPPVGYHEHPTRSVGEVEGTHRVNGADGLAEAFARCRVSLERAPVEKGVRVVDAVGNDEEEVPRVFRPAAEEGIRTALSRGPTGGFPVTGVVVRLIGGAYDLLQSTEAHFRIAGELAAKAALDRAGSRLLEPWSEVDVTVPSDTLGALLSDLGAHRGRVLGVEVTGTEARLQATTPDDELRTFARRVKRLTAGRGRFRSWGIGLEPLPPHLAAAVIGASPHPGRVTLGSGRSRGAESSPPSTKSGRRPEP
jgi:elongation factor G